MKNNRNFLIAAILSVASLFLHSRSAAQVNGFHPPPGETVIGEQKNVDTSEGYTRITWTNKCLYFAVYDRNLHAWDPKGEFYCAPPDLSIRSVLSTRKNRIFRTLIVLSDGSIVEITNSIETNVGQVDLLTGEIPKNLIGDALYTLTTQNIYVSRDTGHTWTIDTTGLGGQAQDIVVDSSQFVYAITYNGLFRQHPDTNIWRAMTLPAFASWNRIFIDRRNQIYLGGAFNGHSVIYRSSNGGATWMADTAGLLDPYIFSFGDDAYGNVYAITALFPVTSGGDKIYRSNGSTWTRIDLPINASNTDSLNQQEIFTAISGDTALIATSMYGVFSSTDRGTTWTESNAGIPAEHFYGLVRTPSNRLLTSTNLGVFSKNASDTVWQKTYPQTGYLGGQTLFSDNTGSIYTLGPLAAKPDVFMTHPRMTMKSTDGGTTWSPDTLGLSAIKGNSAVTFFVDETGTQHLASYGAGATPSSIYVKLPGQSWAGDTAGYLANHNAPQAFGSDGRGSLWMSIGSQFTTLWRRVVTGGAWAPDTAGLGGEILNSFAATKNGKVYAGGFAGVWRRSGSGWSKLPPPSGLYTTTPAYSISIDSSGVLIAGFQHFDANYNSIGDGVFATTNDGQTWTNLRHIDTTTFRQFVSYGDTTYGLSYFDGVFVFTTGASGVLDAPAPITASLDIYPNPTYANVTIVVANARSSKVEVFDVLGNLLTSFNGSQNAFWDGRDATGSEVASGIYIVRVTGVNEQGSPFRASKQIVIQR